MKTVYYHFDSLDSTNAWAKQNIDLFERCALTVISAKSQTAGRGQYGKTWISPPNVNLTASFSFFVEDKAQNPLHITHILAISLCEWLQKHRISPELKWPNDIKVNGKKIAGVLCETVYSSQGLGIITGIGFNVNMPEIALRAIDQPATSLFAETGLTYSLPEVLDQIVGIFSSHLTVFLEKGFSPFQETFERLCTPKTLF